MFNDFIKAVQMLQFVNKISKYTGSNPKNPSIVDNIIYHIFLFLHRMKKQNSLFRNEYVCVDAALILMVYADYLFAPYSNRNSLTEEMMRKCLLAIKGLYSVPIDDLKKMWNNHVEYFADLISEQDDMSDYTTIAEEAAMLFTYDLYRNTYVEFNSDTPILLVGFDKEFMIKTETFSFFKVMVPMIKECIQENT
jgi:hypothetical protein